MILCEKCSSAHNGDYGSGRFCSKTCARSFSTYTKRSQINQVVKLKAQGRPSPLRGRTQTTEHVQKRTARSPESIEQARVKTQKLREDRYLNAAFDDLHILQKKKRVLEEQNGACNKCGITNWLGNYLPLELEHKDGNNQNNDRNNLEVLCPNCHSQTPTWRKAKQPGKKTRKHADDVIVQAIITSKCMNECLTKLNLKWGSAQTIARVMGQYSVKFKD